MAISPEETQRRRRAVEQARTANIRQGYTHDAVLEAANERFIRGEIDLTELRQEMRDAIHALYPLPEPPGRPRYTLEELLAGITPENTHAAVDFGAPVGQEREWGDAPGEAPHRDEIEALLTAIETTAPVILKSLQNTIATTDAMTALLKGTP